MNRDEPLQSLDRYETLTADFGFPNSDSLREATRIIQRLRSGSLRGSYFLEKLTNLNEWASIGFSTRKHEKYAGGAAQVRSFALADLMTLRGLVEESWSE